MSRTHSPSGSSSVRGGSSSAIRCCPRPRWGPVANQRQFETVTKHFEYAVEDGATVAYGGQRDPELGGLFVQPTVLTNTTLAMRSVSEEIFGPVVAFSTFRDEAEAIDLANGTDFGLAGAVWTNDIRRAHRVAAAIRAGTVWINAYRVVAPQVPFGGVGPSGWGRENGQPPFSTTPRTSRSGSS